MDRDRYLINKKGGVTKGHGNYRNWELKQLIPEYQTQTNQTSFY